MAWLLHLRSLELRPINAMNQTAEVEQIGAFPYKMPSEKAIPPQGKHNGQASMT